MRARGGACHVCPGAVARDHSLRIFGTAKDKESIVSFGIKATHPHDVATIIDRSGIAVRAVTHCVMPSLVPLYCQCHLPGVVRPLPHARGGGWPCASLD
jgi:hypothetical protein